MAILTEELDRHACNPETLNASLVSSLIKLDAKASADTIERAFAADHVDLSLRGNWNEARAELGVEGHGWVPDDLADAQPLSPFHTAVGALDEFLSRGRTKPAKATIGIGTDAADPTQKRRQRQSRKRERRNRRKSRKRG